MAARVALCVVALLCAAQCVVAVAPPVFPSVYVMRGIFRLPYGNITEPFVANVDLTKGQQSISYYGGMDQYVFDTSAKTQYLQFPILDKQRCFKEPFVDTPLTPLLPNLASGSWSFAGNAVVNGQQCDRWQNVSVQFNMTNTYDFYVVSGTNTPVQLVMKGYDFIWSSHPDHYILDYVRFAANKTQPDAFNPPSHCHSSADDESPVEAVDPRAYTRTERLHRLLRAVQPELRNSRAAHEFRLFMSKHNKSYRNALELAKRFAIHSMHKNYIAQHNARPLIGFQLGMNHQGDLSQDEFVSLILPKVQRPHANNGADRFHELSGATAPASVDWRQNGSVTGVQDQGVCGSCWTFGSCGSLEGVWQLANGKLYNLAEQQLVDCAWGFNRGAGVAIDMGCGGGFASSAFSWIKNNGGIALQDSYAYLMKNGWCNANDHSSPVKVTGYVNVTSGSESALQDAVANVGPIAIAIDASQPSFRFYLSGVYYAPACKNGIDDLDHEVLAVGYGNAPNPDKSNSTTIPYWWVKNSWSIYWGQKGYIQMSRNRGNNCGVATQATYPLV